jgi:hypothetical protein
MRKAMLIATGLLVFAVGAFAATAEGCSLGCCGGPCQTDCC